MTDFFLRSEDTRLAKNATFLDDLDLVPSRELNGPWGPALVAVAQRGGVHVCWACGELFNGDSRTLRPVEVAAGHARIMLHAKCVNHQTKSARSFEDITRGLQARRFAAKATKAVANAVDSVRESVSGLLHGSKGE